MKIFRKLHERESYYSQSGDCEVISRLFKITTPVDLNNEKELVEKVLRELKAIHPLLRCSIRDLQDESASSDSKGEHFVELNENNDQELNNLEFLCIDLSSLDMTDLKSADICDQISLLLLQRELTIKIDNENELLWRVKFIAINNNNATSNQSGCLDYYCLVTFHHSIIEGRTLYMLLLQLLEIIETMKSGDYVKQQQYDVLKDMISYFHNDFNEFQDATPFKSKNNFNVLIDIGNKEKSILSHLTAQSIEKITITSVKKNYSTRLLLNELIEQIAAFYMRALWLKIDASLLKQIIRLIKEHNVKMNAFLSVTICLAYKKLYQQYCLNEADKNQEIHYGYTISLRQFANDSAFGSTYFENLGNFVNLFLNKVDKEINMVDDEEWTRSFWPLVVEEHSKLVDRINTKQHLRGPNPALNENDLYDFWLSNLGTMPASYSTNSKHKIESCFIFTTSPPEQILNFHNLITIDSQLYWSFIYNSKLFSETAAKQILDNCLQIILKITERG
jgi:hypothetical protein